ncbi:MAG: nucleotidyl transferase AbiEii/AbiGii toxin family protein [Ornithinimicrobium sp.]
MAMVVVGQMLPEGAVKGGTAMALRYGRADARFTQDLDAARIHPLTDFIDDFEAALGHGWGGFTGRVVDRSRRDPRTFAWTDDLITRIAEA